jgi:hypothetical protein
MLKGKAWRRKGTHLVAKEKHDIVQLDRIRIDLPPPPAHA